MKKLTKTISVGLLLVVIIAAIVLVFQLNYSQRSNSYEQGIQDLRTSIANDGFDVSTIDQAILLIDKGYKDGELPLSVGSPSWGEVLVYEMIHIKNLQSSSIYKSYVNDLKSRFEMDKYDTNATREWLKEVNKNKGDDTGG